MNTPLEKIMRRKFGCPDNISLRWWLWSKLDSKGYKAFYKAKKEGKGARNLYYIEYIQNQWNEFWKEKDKIESTLHALTPDNQLAFDLRLASLLIKKEEEHNAPPKVEYNLLESFLRRFSNCPENMGLRFHIWKVRNPKQYKEYLKLREKKEYSQYLFNNWIDAKETKFCQLQGIERHQFKSAGDMYSQKLIFDIWLVTGKLLTIPR